MTKIMIYNKFYAFFRSVFIEPMENYEFLTFPPFSAPSALYRADLALYITLIIIISSSRVPEF